MQSVEQFIKVKTDHFGHMYSEGLYVSSKVLKHGKCTSSSASLVLGATGIWLVH